MNRRGLALWVLFFVFLSNPSAIFADPDEPSSPLLRQERKKIEPSGDLHPADQKKQSGFRSGMPEYIPPLRGAPAGRVGGGTRGSGDGKVLLSVLAPDHVGLTAQKQPSLFWFLSTLTEYPAEFTLIEAQTVRPLVERRLEPLKKPGIQRIRLADYGLYLQENVLYQWFITLIPDPQRRSKDILSGGLIRKTLPPGTGSETQGEEDMAKAVHSRAEAGLWYDAFTAACELIERSPDNVLLRQMRASLLHQVGLDEVAARDLR